MKHSSYHNRLQAWIKNGHLSKHELVYRKIKNTYDHATKTYKGPLEMQMVLVLHFDFNKSFFVRKPQINEYLTFIANCEHNL